MSDLVPSPAAVLQELLVNLATRTAERAWTFVASRLRRGQPNRMRAALETAVSSIDHSSLPPDLDRDGLFDFLASPEATGVLDRLVAFRLLCVTFELMPRPKRAGEARRGPLDSKHAKAEEELRALGILDTEKYYDSMTMDLRREAIRSASLWLGGTLSQTAGDAVYETLARVAVVTVDAIRAEAEDGSALRNDLWHWMNSVEPRLRELSSISSITPFLEFDADLRYQVSAHHQWLRAPHLDREARMPIEQAYVPPHFEYRAPDQNAYVRVSALEFLATIDRTVVLGDPGAGKSSFGGWICRVIATQYERRHVAGRLLTPMFVALREYAPVLRDKSIVEHLESVVKTRYQVSPPPGAIQYLLTQGRLLLVLDGMDEVTDVAERQKLRDAIESFAHRYPMTRLLVTARSIGYDHAALSPSEYETYRLCEFTDRQVAAYCDQWFGGQDEFSPEDRRQRADAFLAESNEHAADLRTNPLLLALLCGVFRGEGSLPRSRPAIYQRCVDLLLRQWDAMRQIKVDEPLGDHLERTLRHLADWIFHDSQLAARGVAEEVLVRKCADFLRSVRTEDEELARAIAESFVDFCRDRAWILVEVGQGIFAFAHRTFLEFFAAQHLEKASRTPADLAAKLERMIGGDATVVPHLALQLANAARDDAGDEILRSLMNCAEDQEDDQVRKDLLLFIVEALRFVVPRPATTRRLAREAALGLLRDTLADTTRYDYQLTESPWPTVTAGLAAISEPNVLAAAAGFKDGMEHAVRVSDREEPMTLLRQNVERQRTYLARAWYAAYPELADATVASTEDMLED